MRWYSFDFTKSVQKDEILRKLNNGIIRNDLQRSMLAGECMSNVSMDEVMHSQEAVNQEDIHHTYLGRS